MPAMKKKAFEGLTESIRETGKWISENAEAIVPDVEYLKGLTIRVSFDPEEIPVVNIDYDAISLEAASAWCRANRSGE